MKLNVVGTCKNCLRKKIDRLKERYKGKKVTISSKPEKVGRRRWEAKVKIS